MFLFLLLFSMASAASVSGGNLRTKKEVVSRLVVRLKLVHFAAVITKQFAELRFN